MTSEKADGYGQAGDLEALKARLWAAVESAASLLKSRKPETKLRAVHATAQAGAAYHKLIADSDLEARLEHLEERAEQLSRAANEDNLPVFGAEGSHE